MTSRRLFNFLGLFSYILSRIGCIFLIGMMMLTVVDVFGRYVFNKPILGAFEMTEFMVLVVVFSFLAYAQSQNAHVTVDLLVDQFPTTGQKVVGLINHLLSLFLFVLITWKGYDKIIDAYESGEKPLNLPLPDWPFVIFMTVGCLVLCVEYFRDVVKVFSKEPKAGEDK